MTHRLGHVEETGEDCCSMDRRKYLSTLAAGATFGAVAIGVAACGGGGSESKATDTTTTPADTSTDAIQRLRLAGDEPIEVTGKKLWGYLRVFPSNITRVADARKEQIETIETIRIPYFNNTGLDLAANPIFGFNLLRIGCPAKFAIAINLTVNDDHTHHPTNPQDTIDRNNQMDKDLVGMGFKVYPWTGVDAEPCK